MLHFEIHEVKYYAYGSRGIFIINPNKINNKDTKFRLV